MDVMQRLANSIVVPVVVLEKVEDAVPTAKAMAAGGVDTMEITFRTACAPEAIKAVAENCPEAPSSILSRPSWLWKWAQSLSFLPDSVRKWLAGA